MKKFALLSLSALMMLAVSCSDDKETPRPPIPTEPVQTVPSVADQVTLNLPEQDLNYEKDGSLYRFNYSNGQVLAFALSVDETLGNYAVLRRISGENVVIPPTVKMKEDGEEVIYNVIAFNLYQNGNEGVKTITMSKTINYGFDQGILAELSPEWIRWQLSVLPDLESFEIENGMNLYCSINGAIYTADKKTLVGVPRAKTNVFTIANETEIVDSKAFQYCSKLTGITFPASVVEIGEEAVVNTDMLVLINMQPTVAPKTYANTFGQMAVTSRLCIPAGAKDSYFPVKPDLVKPVAPAEPDDDASDEEYDAYLEASAQYKKDLAAYNEAMDIYDRPVGFRNFTDVVEVTF